MIIDSHCHAWKYWPYRPPVPDPEVRGRVEQLLHEMDQNGVQQAVIVSAQIDHNPFNNSYIAEQVKRYPSRLYQLADLDSEWSSTYQQPGASERLQTMANQYPLVGFTHYPKKDDDGGWLHSPEGFKLFKKASELNLIASISSMPHQQAAIRRAAEAYPDVPILCHHLSHVKSDRGALKENLQEVLKSAKLSNIYIKVSGFAYAAETAWEYPYSDVRWVVESIYDHFGPQRMCWGSDYPVCRYFMTYRQSLEAARTHCAFIPEAEMEMVLGGTLNSLIQTARESKV